MGRPSSYSPELAATILDRIADGESLRAICRDDGMPDRRTVLRWLDADEEFAARCARARLLQADALEEDMADIEAKTLGGQVDPQTAKVVLSSKQWRAAKLAPKRYGDRQAIDVTGEVSISTALVEARKRAGIG